MKLRVFQSDKGDCLLLTSRTGANVLIDGGMANAFTTQVQPFLGELAEAGQRLHLVYVSHIDQDHIAGVLQLLDNIMLWRVHEYRKGKGLSTKVPSVPRMPAIDGIWHNAFSTLIGENAGEAEDLLAQSSRLLSLSADPQWAEAAAEHHELAYSISEAIRVSRRIAADQLAIPLNAEFGGQLILVREPAGPSIDLGGMAIHVVGPFAKDVEALKVEWNDWLRANKAKVAGMRAKAKDDAAKIGQSADGLASALDIYLKQLGNRDAVTAGQAGTPNRRRPCRRHRGRPPASRSTDSRPAAAPGRPQVLAPRVRTQRQRRLLPPGLCRPLRLLRQRQA